MSEAPMRPTRFLLLVAVLGLAFGSQAQQHPNTARGIGGGSLPGGPDSIAMFNGNLSIAIPIGIRYPLSSGFDYGLTLVYNSKPWDARQRDGYTRVEPSQSSNAGLGWRLSPGELLSPTSLRNTSGQWVYEAPDGSQHVFYSTLHNGDPVTNGVLYSRDGSYLRLKHCSAVSCPPDNSTFSQWATYYSDLEFPDGRVQRFYHGMVNLTVSRLRDRFGNWVEFVFQYFEGAWEHPMTIHDSEGRMHTVYYMEIVGVENMVVRGVNLAGPNGTTAVYDFGYSFGPIQRGCGDNDPQTPADAEVALLSSVSLPDGSSWSFPSHLTSSEIGRPCSTGLLTRMRLPTLGHVEWEYKTWQFTSASADAERPRYRLSGLSKRRLLDANGSRFLNGTGQDTHEWVFDTALTSCGLLCVPREMVNSMTTPEGDRSIHYFSVKIPGASDGGEGWEDADYGMPFTRNPARQTSPGRFLSTEIFSKTNNRVRSTFVRFEREPQFASSAEHARYDTNRRLVSTRTVFDDDSARYADLDFSDFDGLGHYRLAVSEGNFDSGNVRSAFTNFNPAQGTLSLDAWGNILPGFSMLPASSEWILGTFTTTSVTEASVTRQAEYCFAAATGFLERHRTYSGRTTAPACHPTTPCANDRLVVFTPDAKGNVAREQHYGGDTQALGSAALCSLSLPSTDQFRINHVYEKGVLKSSQHANGTNTPLSFKVVDRDIDAKTGLPLATRDIAGLQTNYQYDVLGRVTRAVTSPGHGAVTEWVYHRALSAGTPARVEQRHWNNAQTVILARSETVYDAFGRLIKERHLMPQANGSSGGTNWSTREHGYNALGWKTFVSEMEASESPVNRTTFTNFDSFGRARSIQKPDQKVVTLGYLGERVITRTTDVRTGGNAATHTLTPSTTTEIYDRQGRLFQVKEPSRPGGIEATTQYVYNPLGQISGVITWGAEATQARYFTYDGRGLLVSEQQPEKGSSGNGLVSYPSYDASGRLLQQIDGGVDLRFEYDRAGRPTVVREGSGRLWKQFYYGTTNQTGNWRNGKLTTAVRHNHHDRFGMNITITEHYGYGGRDGRVSLRDTISSEGTSFAQEFTWNDLGQIASMQYPYCTGSCSQAGIFLTNTYGNGFLTAIPGYASSIKYHPNGTVAEATLGTGAAKWTQQNDANAMTRPASISTSGVWPSNWSSGGYQYDAAGNIVAIGQDYYLYDAVSRLTFGTSEAGTKSQSQTYDTFGNLTSLSPRNLSVSSATNRLTSASNPSSVVSYDARGNVTFFDGLTYEYDALGMLRGVNGAGHDWLYLYTADDERLWSYDLAGNTSWWRVRDLEGKVRGEFVNISGNWNAMTNYIYRGSTLHASYSAQRSPTHYYYAVDHLGSPRRLVDQSGMVWGSHAYFGFGKESTNPLQDGERMKFTGHERDLCCDGMLRYTDNMHARQYSPLLGRFLSVDPVNSGKPTRPQTWNRYSYAWNRPLNLVDPNGEEPIDPTMARFLGDYFGRNVSHVQVFGGPLSRSLAFVFNRAEAVTFGQRVFFSGAGWEAYKAKTAPGIGLTGHEARHTIDYARLGFFGFLREYLRQWAAFGSDHMPLEVAAEADREAILKLLAENPGLLQSIQDGTYGRGSMFKESPVYVGVYGGMSFIFNWQGVLFIDGVNLTGVFTDPLPRGGRF